MAESIYHTIYNWLKEEYSPNIYCSLEYYDACSFENGIIIPINIVMIKDFVIIFQKENDITFSDAIKYFISSPSFFDDLKQAIDNVILCGGKNINMSYRTVDSILLWLNSLYDNDNLIVCSNEIIVCKDLKNDPWALDAMVICHRDGLSVYAENDWPDTVPYNNPDLFSIIEEQIATALNDQ